jgi:hypothetical protein
VIRDRWYVEGLFSEFVPISRLFFATGMATLREHWGMALNVSRDIFIKLETDRIQALFFGTVEF